MMIVEECSFLIIVIDDVVVPEANVFSIGPVNRLMLGGAKALRGVPVAKISSGRGRCYFERLFHERDQ